jgi:hypothetical protein
MIIGGFSALFLGGAMPTFVLFWGDMTQSFNSTKD